MGVLYPWKTYTNTYSILEIAEASYNDIRQRLDDIGYLDHYLTEDDQYGEILIFGTTALAKEQKNV